MSVKILIIENSVDVTGALKSALQSASYLRNEFEFHFVIPKHSKTQTWIEANGFRNVYRLPLKELNRQPLSLILYIPLLLLNTIRLNAIVKRNSIELIHVNDIYNLLPVTLHLFGRPIPYVCHIRFLPDRFPKWLFKIWYHLHLNFSRQLIAVSRSVAAMLPQNAKLQVVYNELPLPLQRSDIYHQSEEKHRGTFLYLSNFIKGKGQDYAVEAFAKVHLKLPNWKLRMVGGDLGLKKNREFRSFLEQKAKKLGVLEKIEWKGFTGDVEAEYRRAKIVLNFSESESFSMTCLEALFFGRPVIASDCGGPSEIIDHEQSGLIVPNRDVNAMAKAMLDLAKDVDLREDMGRYGYGAVREKFSEQNTSMKIYLIYKNILGK